MNKFQVMVHIMAKVIDLTASVTEVYYILSQPMSRT